jgi:hypothetical protein
MIREHIILSGSLNISGSFIVPSGTSGSEPINPQPGNLFFNTSEKRLYIWEEEWVAAGSQITPIPSGDIEYLVVAGGGGGGLDMGGGGGAGGCLSSSLFSVTSGSGITIVVGAGGSGWTDTVNRNGQASSGQDSSITGNTFSTITAIGGGGGGAGQNTDGRDGGSGGGASSDGSFITDGGIGTSGQGYNGGSSTVSTYRGGGGGGGASEPGANSPGNDNGGDGGDGKQSSITGTPTYYAGGGGGGSYNVSFSGGVAGLGGGGNGGGTAGANGTANTGGGAGGGSGSGPSPGGNGGSGVVILSYNSGSINAIGGQEGNAGNGKKYHKIYNSSFFHIGDTSDFKVITDGLYVHYDLANTNSYPGSGTTITDLQGNVDLTIVSTPPFTGLNGGGLDLDGSTDYAYTSSLSFTPYCIDYWWTNDDTIGTGVMQGNYQQVLGLGSYPGGITLGAFTGGMTDETIAFWGNADISNGATYIREVVNIGTHNIVINWNGTTYDIWVDGVKKTTYAMDTNGHCTLHSRDSIFLGKDDGGGGYEFDGKIHNFRIYTSSLDDSQVLQNYNALRKRFGV